MNVVLIGNPNSGKSTLINALTGSRERTGNWPGVTVEKKTGTFTHEGTLINITDLPGTYTLTPPNESTSPDEKITYAFIAQEKIDWIINVIDASNFERNLYLTSQLLEKGVPIIIALNKMDLVKKKSWQLDEKKLASLLGCPVVSLESHKNKGILALKNQLIQPCHHAVQYDPKPIIFPDAIEHGIQLLDPKLLLPEQVKRTSALSCLENPEYASLSLPPEHQKALELLQRDIEQKMGAEPDIIIASTRYQFAQKIANDVVSIEAQAKKIAVSDQLDRIFLNRILGIPLFFGIMYALFFFSFQLGKVFQDFFEILGETLFVNGSAYWLSQAGMPKWSIALISQGVGKGINTTLSFIPVLSVLFLSLSFLEMSGYMTRAAFIMDRLMKIIGLSGKSFIPLMIGFGCNVPAIMAARTLPNEKDRILTIMMTPFMSCSARLAIYSIFVGAFFPAHGENIIFLLYFIGMLMAILTAWLLKHRIKQDTSSHNITEMPAYHLPAFSTLFQIAFQRLKGFILKAGAIILPVSVVIYLLNAITLDGSISFQEWHPDSVLAALGKMLTPLFHPMGIQEENWPATVGLLSGVLAKEVVIGTLNTLYSQAGPLVHETLQHASPGFHFWESLRLAFASIPENLVALKSSLSPSFLNPSPDQNLTANAYGIMYQRFEGKTGAFAYLLFTLLYVPCMSTFAIIAKELNRKWALISILWSTGLAYSTAVLFYQIATMPLHVMTSWVWILTALSFLTLTLFSINQMVKPKEVSA